METLQGDLLVLDIRLKEPILTYTNSISSELTISYDQPTQKWKFMVQNQLVKQVKDSIIFALGVIVFNEALFKNYFYKDGMFFAKQRPIVLKVHFS